MSKPSSTETQLLDVTQALIQERGFNAISYKDVAEAVGIRKASIHYHFPAKTDLGLALMKRYRSELDQALAQLDQQHQSAKARLRGFIALYRSTLDKQAICLCGSLAADLRTLPEEMQDEVAAYLDRSAAWVASTLRAGVKAGEFALTGSAPSLGKTLVAGLQGALLMARACGESAAALQDVERNFLNHLNT